MKFWEQNGMEKVKSFFGIPLLMKTVMLLWWKRSIKTINFYPLTGKCSPFLHPKNTEINFQGINKGSIGLK